MGPYCKFCNDRCFAPTTSHDYISKDIRATCHDGVKFDMSSEYPELIATDDKTLKGWLLELKREREYSLAVEIIGGELQEFEVRNDHIEEIIDLVSPHRAGKRRYYRIN